MTNMNSKKVSREKKGTELTESQREMKILIKNQIAVLELSKNSLGLLISSLVY